MTPDVTVLEEHAVDRRPGRRARLWLLAAAIVVLVIPALATRLLRGHRIDGRLAPNHAESGFDFATPTCEPTPRPADAGADDVLIRYLGVSGLWIEWRGRALVTAPYFSAHGLFAAELGDAGWDEELVAAGARWFGEAEATTVLAGHAHFDHIGDLPPLLTESLPEADLWVNRSGRHVLAGFPALTGRMHELEPLEGRWIRPSDPGGAALPFRFKPIRSGHAGTMLTYHYAPGEVERDWASWEGHRLDEMLEGTTWAFLIDLLEDDGDGTERIRYRIHFQDAASDAPEGFPDAADLAEHPVDLAVVCMPSWWKVDDYPGGLLRESGARHALVTHYEDFFRPRTAPTRFVPLLTDRRARGFLHRVADAIPETGDAGPRPRACGPSGDRWTMPLPGEWLRFPGAMLRPDEPEAQPDAPDLQGAVPAAG